MKKNFTLVLLTLVSICFAQPPAGYYNTATGTGFTLKTQLHIKINNHFDQGYSGLYTTYQTSDIKSNGRVWDMYSNCDFIFGTVANGGNQDNGTNPGNECALFNREHTVPQSYFGSGLQPMYSDAHFVIPSDKIVNATRNDYPYGVVNNPTYVSGNGSKLGNNLNSGYSAGYSSTVFEPVNEYKGDIARILLYFATRYEDQLVTYYSSNSAVKAMFDGTSNNSFSTTFLNILLTWHQQDPVSAKEIARNNAIYSRQNNRNPFIDRPEFACQIWGSACAALNIHSINNLANVTISPNPSTDGRFIVTSADAIDAISVININGQIIQQIINPAMMNSEIEVSNLSKGFYFITLESNSQRITKKVIVN